MPQVHELRTWPREFRAIRDGLKTCEHRIDDRGFKVGDVLLLREWDPDPREYTGQSEEREIAFIDRGGGFGISPGHVVLSLRQRVSRSFPSALTAGQLAEWHQDEGMKATTRANGHAEAVSRLRAAEGKNEVAASRSEACADAGYREASFHLAAAQIVRALAEEQGVEQAEKCFICDEPFKAGDRMLDDVSGETGHLDCFGPDRESFVKDVETGEPLGPNDPLPTGYLWESAQ